MQPRDVFLGCNLVEGCPIDQLPFQLIDFLRALELDARNLFPFAVSPDSVQVTQKLVDEGRGQVVTVSLTKFMGHGKCLLGHPLVLLLFHINLIHTLDLPAGVLDEPIKLPELPSLLQHFHELRIVLPELFILNPDDPLPKTALPHVQILIQPLQLHMLLTHLVI